MMGRDVKVSGGRRVQFAIGLRNHHPIGAYGIGLHFRHLNE